LASLGIESDRRTEVGDGVVVVAFLVVGGPPIAEGRDVFGIEPDRLAEIANGPIDIALVEPGDAPAVEDGAVLEAEPDRLVEVGDGAVVIAVLVPGGAPVAVADRLLGVRQFPRIDALRTGRNSGVGIAQIEARLGGGGVTQGRHGGSDVVRFMRYPGAKSVSWNVVSGFIGLVHDRPEKVARGQRPSIRPSRRGMALLSKIWRLTRLSVGSE